LTPQIFGLPTPLIPPTSLYHINDFDHHHLMPYQKFLHAPLSGAPQKCFQSGPALVKAGPVIKPYFQSHQVSPAISENALTAFQQIRYLSSCRWTPVHSDNSRMKPQKTWNNVNSNASIDRHQTQ